MKLTPLGIEGAWLAESHIWKDDRGFFREWFKAEDIERETGRNFGVEQANISVSSAGTIRGLHYSMVTGGQAKWITCVAGSIQDVIVDIRPESKTYSQWVEVKLDGDSGEAVFISEGLGHGFLALKENTVVAYLVSTPFSPTHEYEINPLDEEIGIQWRKNSSEMKISEKDRNAPSLHHQFLNRNLPTLTNKSH